MTIRFEDVRAEFASVLFDLRALKLNYADDVIQGLLAKYVDDLRAALKQISPRARAKPPAFSTSLQIGDDVALGMRLEHEANFLFRKVAKVDSEKSEQIRSVWWPKINERADALYAQQSQLIARLKGLASEAAIHRAGPDGYWHFLDSRRDDDYRSQGYGASRYAEGAVQIAADVARAEGFVDGYDLLVLRHDDVCIAVVRVEDDLDVQILRRLPGIPLREQVRLCWKRGVNPRVFNPWLPHNFEHEAGLDYSGNDLRATSKLTNGE